MRVTKLVLQNFKRFTHLELIDIPIEAKLVLLIGVNGSGKSSIFDAFQAIVNVNRGGRVSYEYYRKNKDSHFEVHIEDETGELLQLGEKGSNFMIDLDRRYFYGRTSLRHIPQLTRKSLGFDPKVIAEDNDRPVIFIERDLRFENDVEYITQSILEDVFRSGPNTSTEHIKARYVTPINEALSRIFGTENGTALNLLEIIPPLQGNIAQINFQKGNSLVHYNFLSSGEKEIFNVLVDLLVRKNLFRDGICYFDELDLHLNTAIQSRFLAEITENWIPDTCQLWTASHSLGFIDYARNSDRAVILDFDNFDFDQPQTIAPQLKDRLDIYEIAVPKSILFEMMRGKKLVVCENQNDEYYNLLGLPDTVFVGVKDSRDVFLHVKRDHHYFSLRDRDFLSDTEIERIRNRFPQHRILKYYDFENYIYHPDNIAELSPAGFEKEVYVREIAKQKNERLHYILPGLVSSRQNYEEFKTDEKLRDKDIDSIVDDFKSDEFERFYKYFDMKDRFNKHYLATFNLSKKDLVTTVWFKSQIAELLT